MKNLFLMVSVSTLGILALSSSLDDGLRKSTLNQCVNNNDNSACEYLLTKGNKFQQVQAKKVLLIRGL